RSAACSTAGTGCGGSRHSTTSSAPTRCTPAGTCPSCSRWSPWVRRRPRPESCCSTAVTSVSDPRELLVDGCVALLRAPVDERGRRTAARLGAQAADSGLALPDVVDAMLDAATGVWTDAAAGTPAAHGAAL